MKGGHNKKSVRVEFVMSEPEAELVKERMAELGLLGLTLRRKLGRTIVTGLVGFEPTNAGIKILCLTAWR